MMRFWTKRFLSGMKTSSQKKLHNSFSRCTPLYNLHLFFMLLNFNGVYRMTRIREPFKIEYVCSMGRSSPSTLRQPEFRTSPAALRRLWGMDPPKDLPVQKTNMDSRWLIHVRTLHLLRFQGFFLLSNFFLMFFLVGLPVKSHGDGNYPSLSITKGIFKRSVSGAGILDYRRVTPLRFHVLKSISEVFPSWKKNLPIFSLVGCSSHLSTV